MVVGAAADFGPLVAEHGLDFEPFSFGMMDGVRSELGQKWLGGTSTSQRREAYLMRKAVRHLAEPLADDLLRLADRADAFVSGPLTFEAMEVLASRVGLSASRFRRLFRAATGVTVRRYRVWIAMGAAVRAIAEGETLTDAALGAGFSSSAHFSAAFREMFGLEPSRLAKGRLALTRAGV